MMDVTCAIKLVELGHGAADPGIIAIWMVLLYIALIVGYMLGQVSDE